MKISVNWLKELVPIKWSVDELVQALSVLGFPAESVTRTGVEIPNIVAAKILTVEKHPNADRLQVARVNDGKGERQIVCGAPNIAPGQVVPLALPGTKFDNGLEIVVSKIRGVESHGMLCSARELGLSGDHSGILMLPENAPLGKEVRQILAGDTVIDIEVTPNRPDVLSHVGLAREIAAYAGVSLKLPAAKWKAAAKGEPCQIKINEPALCPRYMGKLLHNVTVAPSPQWMVDRLTACGIRSINNIVDVTNYVLLEWGHPLHAFDLEKLADRQIIVRHAKDREKLPALDEKTYELKSEDLVIADAEKAVAIAGIMGGQETGVTAATKHILLESAVFDPGRVRATSRRLALKSESSARFEKGTDAETAALVSLRAASLMLELAGGQPGRETDAYPKKTKPTAITLKASRVNDVIGLSIAPKRVETVLKSQGYAVKAAKGAWTCTVPAHRKDIAYDVDVIEDVIRLIGYDAVPETLPPLALNTLPAHFRSLPVAGLTDILKGAGLNETMSSSFCSLVFAEKLGFKREALVPLLNPLSQEESFLRPALSTTLLGAVMRNINFQRDSVALFEIGRTYHAAADYPRETRTLGIALYGSLREKSVHDAEKNYSFFEIKGLLELIRERLGRPLAFKEGSSVSFLHPHQSVEILCEGKPAGWAGLVHPSLSTEWGFTRPCALAEINLELLLARISGTTQAKALPKYPAVQRDIAIVVDKASAWGQLEKTVREAGGTLVKSIRPFDVFAGGQLEASKKSVAFRITLQHEEHTLSDTEITSVVDKIKTSLRDRCGAQLR